MVLINAAVLVALVLDELRVLVERALHHRVVNGRVLSVVSDGALQNLLRYGAEVLIIKLFLLLQDALLGA